MLAGRLNCAYRIELPAAGQRAHPDAAWIDLAGMYIAQKAQQGKRHGDVERGRRRRIRTTLCNSRLDPVDVVCPRIQAMAACRAKDSGYLTRMLVVEPCRSVSGVFIEATQRSAVLSEARPPRGRARRVY